MQNMWCTCRPKWWTIVITLKLHVVSQMNVRVVVTHICVWGVLWNKWEVTNDFLYKFMEKLKLYRNHVTCS